MFKSCKNEVILKSYIFFIFIAVFTSYAAREPVVTHKKHKRYQPLLCRDRPYRSCLNKFGFIVGDIVQDALKLNWYLFSVTSAKVITGFIPPYLLTRQFDERIQCHFYDEACHKNVNQFPKACHTIAKNGVGIPMVLLSSLVVFAPDEDLRQTARMFIIGLPFVHSGKDIIKKMRSKCCLRPWNENFSCTKRSSGGFPSGHMANVTYAATLFGIRHGLEWAIPLSCLAAFVFADFVNCNRHYVSQLIAGAGLGVLYALAADQVIKRKFSEHCSCSVGRDEQGHSTIKVAYKF
ncbi:MAG: phosphatase PAP2 family protein [Candidatus Babeliales bacterium]